MLLFDITVIMQTAEFRTDTGQEVMIIWVVIAEKSFVNRFVI